MMLLMKCIYVQSSNKCLYSASGLPSSSSTLSASPEFASEDGRCGFLDLPEELVVNIAEYLLELDLSRLSQVSRLLLLLYDLWPCIRPCSKKYSLPLPQTCRRFSRICNDSEMWRHLYVDLFEYDRPLILKDKERKFVFIDENDDAFSSSKSNGTERCVREDIKCAAQLFKGPKQNQNQMSFIFLQNLVFICGQFFLLYLYHLLPQDFTSARMLLLDIKQIDKFSVIFYVTVRPNIVRAPREAPDTSDTSFRAYS